jgi:hypothetical protein
LLDTREYDKALYYASHLCCQDLIILMVQTKDDLLSKKIEQFILSFKFEDDIKNVEEKRQQLIEYISHATDALPIKYNEYAF